MKNLNAFLLVSSLSLTCSKKNNSARKADNRNSVTLSDSITPLAKKALTNKYSKPFNYTDINSVSKESKPLTDFNTDIKQASPFASKYCAPFPPWNT